ncbi:uncharacterized protein LOC129898601 [Solanum dulcamara]|uniref:uncharacterized protein LOC129898601 n=1 Tax=Solanum dulcamara TaxID=45834 RepID=UPI0024865C83|nr:uncharacterized protein LOC129898601 [Solanum dulcamara]
MRRKTGTLFINPKIFGSLQKPCVKDMVTFLNCSTLNHNKDDKCSRQNSLLSACIESQSGKNRKPWGIINYHLQRLNRGRK